MTKKEDTSNEKTESLLIAAENNVFKELIILKWKMVIYNRIPNVGYVETEMKGLIT